MELYIGIMSGTSVDAIDLALVEFKENNLKMHAHYTANFPKDLQNEIINLISTFETNLDKLGTIDHRLGVEYAKAVNTLIENSTFCHKDIKAIACHGQTIFHKPIAKYPFTSQIGDGTIIASRTGIKTINDFRRMDVAVGGEGAPLTPAFHNEFLYSEKENRAILNLGGISNITVLNKDESKVVGYDIGPANCLIDLWIQKIKGEQYDKDGNWAKSGNINQTLLNSFLEEEYFTKKFPKSTGKELFNKKWLTPHLNKFYDINETDIHSTITELTAISITNQIKNYHQEIDSLYLCGGGAYNCYLKERMQTHLPNVRIGITDELNIPSQWVEAIAFAWLGMKRFKNEPSNLPSVTGAKRKVLLGNIIVP
jgi:anhydro-N-acetylmuramic acid kinase